MMTIQNKLLRTFAKLVETSSFTVTAECLRMTQPAVTYRITQLEDALDMRLLDRGSIGSVPTAAGKQAYEIIKKIMALEDELASLSGVEMPVEHGVSNSTDVLRSRLNAVIDTWAKG